MPEKRTIRRARQDRREGKSASTQAGEFVHEEIAHIREGKHGARSAKQAIAIGLSKARRAGVDLPPPKKGEASEETRRKARRDVAAGTRTAAASKTARKAAKTTARKTATKTAVAKRGAAKKTAVKRPAARKASAGASTATPSRSRSRATIQALKREDRAAASPLALSRQAKKAARKRTTGERSAAAKKAARTKGAEGRSEAARKAARTRARHDGRRRHNGASAHA
jgi:hypothetical protein